MSAIGPGDWVECLVVREPAPGARKAGFRLGALYCVERVGQRGSPWLHLVGMPTPRDCGINGDGWNARCFRPIYRPDETLTKRLMEPLPDALAPEQPERSEPETA